MRSLHIIGALGALGIGVAGWATLGQAGPKAPPTPAPPDPIPGEVSPPARPMPRTRPADDPFEDPPPVPSRAEMQDAIPPNTPVRVLDPIDVPDVPGLPSAAPAHKEPPTAIRPSVFIPKPDNFVGQKDAPRGEEPRPIPKVGEARPLPRVDVLKPVPASDDPVPAPGIPAVPAIPTVAPMVSAGPPPTATAPGGPPAGPVPAVQQEPAIRLEWHGPATLQVGSPAEYTLVARNTSAVPLHKVIVQVKVPAGAKVTSVEPKADGTASVLLWDHGVIPPGEEKAVKLTFVPPGRGEALCQAWVTFTGSASLKLQVREPKLAVVARAPEKVAVGDAATLVVAVSNPGDHPAEDVKLAVVLGPGLESTRGQKHLLDLGPLDPGETREVKVPCLAKAAGAQTCEVTAEGAGALKARTTAALSVVQPKLHVEVAGPKLRYPDRKAAYAVKVSNPGDAPASAVSVTGHVPAGFNFVAAEAGGKFDPDARTISWTVGEVVPGLTKEFKYELVASGIGEFTHKAVAAGERGVRAEQTLVTKVEGVSALAMEVVDTDDPVEAGAETSYEVRVANTGSKDETDVRVVCNLPPQMKFKAAAGPGKYDVVGNDVVFDTVRRLPAKTEVTFKVTVTAKVKGDARFKATLTAGGLSEPVTAQESTRVYSD